MEDNDLQAPKVISLDTLGLITYRRFADRDEDKVELILVDTTMKAKWRGYIPLARGFTLIASKASGSTVYFLYKFGNAVVSDLIILSVRVLDGNYTIMPIQNFIPFNFFEFEVTSKAIIIGGYFNYRPLVMYVDLATQKAKILPGLFNEAGELTQIKAAGDGSFDVVLMAKNADRVKCLWIRNYDAEGGLLKTTIVAPDRKKNFIFGRSVKTADSSTVVVGVYGRFTDYSRGIFLSEIDAAGGYQTKYYNFGDLKNFFSYMRAKREQRVKNRIERRKVKGKKIKFNYRILVQELVPYNNQVIMLGEAFYPHYTYRSRNFGNSPLATYYSYTSSRGDLVFDGFQYTHAVVIGFDEHGNLKWDNSFEIGDIKSMQLNQTVRIGVADDKIVLLYPFENTVRSKIISNNKVIEGKASNDMKTNIATDVVKNKETEMSKLDYWYHHHFFAFGVQTIRSTVDRTASRKVFFINKLSYR